MRVRRAGLLRDSAASRCLLRRLQHVSACQHSACLPHDGVLALSRDRDFYVRLVPSCGITMDERIRNLMRERGHQDMLMNVDDADLEPKLLTALEKLCQERESVAMGSPRPLCGT